MNELINDFFFLKSFAIYAVSTWNFKSRLKNVISLSFRISLIFYTMISTEFALNFSCAFVQDEEITFSTRETSVPSGPHQLSLQDHSQPFLVLTMWCKDVLHSHFSGILFIQPVFRVPRCGILMRNLFIICAEFKRENLINVFHDKKKRWEYSSAILEGKKKWWSTLVYNECFVDYK